MNITTIEVVKASIYISISILLINLLKNRILSKYTSVFKYILCIGITLRGVFIFKVNIALPEFLDSLINTTEKTSLQNIDTISQIQGSNINILEIVFCIWIVGVLITSIYYLHYNFKLYKKIHNFKIEINSLNICDILENCKKDFKIKKKIKIYKLNGIYSPMIIGIINPIIIIPNREYKKSDLNYIFKHELIHYKRKDNLLKVILTIFNIIHWYNPIISGFVKYFDDQCELSCDELVTKRFSLNEIKEYSMLLLDTMKYKNRLESSMCVSHLSSSKSNIIKNRIESILSFDKRKKGNFICILLFLLTLISMVSFVMKNDLNTAYSNENITSKNYNSEKDDINSDEIKNLDSEDIKVTINRNYFLQNKIDTNTLVVTPSINPSMN